MAGEIRHACWRFLFFFGKGGKWKGRRGSGSAADPLRTNHSKLGAAFGRLRAAVVLFRLHHNDVPPRDLQNYSKRTPFSQ